MSGEAGSVSIPQAIAFEDKVFHTPCRKEEDILSSSITTTSVSPLRSEPFSGVTDTSIEEHILVKTIREQIQKQPSKCDPPAWTKHLSSYRGCTAEKRNEQQENRDDGSKESESAEKTKMVAREPTQSVTTTQREIEQIAAIAEKARAEIVELEAQLTRQEAEAQRLAEQAAAMVAQLEIEADKKSKMAEVAILKAKLALQCVDSQVKNGSQIAEAIAKIISKAEKGVTVAEDRAEISSISSPRDERQEHSVDTNNEVSGINEIDIDIAEPPKIIRQTEVPADLEDKKGKKELTVVTDIEDAADEFVISPLDDASPRKRSMDDGSTIETIYRKIEECQQTILNPNVSMEEQSKAAELMEKMARLAKITEFLEPKKSVVGPLSCVASTESAPKEA
ncbi:hypothetical protein IV203_022431 [Nitzschia inconspicua]|uniref:Uncharacterized protein n=1 Tax=Nitzschia inconspicua TaxID=303405 RepID=A0A9K3KIN5_9STRA|nr:hypothetical protein IV203_024590 [Nitzschia inconspicua]KAG7344423.1 hypothetical protein IV203_022431 [Nitzschia inconspicua]